MSNILRGIVVAAIAVAALASSAQVHRGQKSVGLRGGYVTRNHSGMVGLGLTYALSSRVRLAPAVGYAYKHQGEDAFLFSLDAQYIVPLSSRVSVYPLAGVEFSSWNYPGTNDTSQRTTRLGMDVGAGAEYYATPSLRLSLEARYDWVRRFDTGLFMAGISFVF